jgi:hypothetical protein
VAFRFARGPSTKTHCLIGGPNWLVGRPLFAAVPVVEQLRVFQIWKYWRCQCGLNGQLSCHGAESGRATFNFARRTVIAGVADHLERDFVRSINYCAHRPAPWAWHCLAEMPGNGGDGLLSDCFVGAFNGFFVTVLGCASILVFTIGFS